MREQEGGTVLVNGTAREFEAGTTMAEPFALPAPETSVIGCSWIQAGGV